jgi:hypothetical protein
LKVVSANHSDDYEPPAVIKRLQDYGRDHGFPNIFLLELERLFHTSRNGRHLCQVFPCSALHSTRSTTLTTSYIRHLRGISLAKLQPAFVQCTPWVFFMEVSFILWPDLGGLDGMSLMDHPPGTGMKTSRSRTSS